MSVHTRSIVELKKAQRFAPFAEQVGHAEFLLLPRFSAQHVTVLAARRYAAVAQRDDLRREQAEERAAVDADRARLNEELETLKAEV